MLHTSDLTVSVIDWEPVTRSTSYLYFFSLCILPYKHGTVRRMTDIWFPAHWKTQHTTTLSDMWLNKRNTLRTIAPRVLTWAMVLVFMIGHVMAVHYITSHTLLERASKLTPADPFILLLHPLLNNYLFCFHLKLAMVLHFYHMSFWTVTMTTLVSTRRSNSLGIWMLICIINNRRKHRQFTAFLRHHCFR